MNYFDHCTDLNELKAEYRRLALKYHPDLGGDTATMQAIKNDAKELGKLTETEIDCEILRRCSLLSEKERNELIAHLSELVAARRGAAFAP